MSAPSIMLEMASASDEHEMWERRWNALRQMYAIERCFADSDGRWGLRDFLDYAGQACGYSSDSGRLPKGEDAAKTAAECEASQSGAEGNRHNPPQLLPPSEI